MNVESIFAAASQKPSTERAAFLEQACGDDAQLRRQVHRLLAAHDAAGDFLEAPAHGATQDYTPTTNEPGQTIGPYKLLQLLGEGGMGTVWVAEQEQPVKRRVALKLIKAGMDSAQVLRRFEAERQALAMMDHTNIAKVLDAGTTPQGRPYFAMELVKGVPITKYCDELHLSLRERLDLFVPVCRAIQHAHQKGIIHRDIKPSNVLVAVQDGKPVPKVIDFGVAKAMQQRLTDQSMYTEIGAVIGTLEYMSPEQAELSALDIDTRTDVYALGVLLYELLTGSTPLDRKRLKQAAFAEMLRIIKEVEPPKPSTRLTDSKDSLANLAAQRRTEPAKLSKAMRGELDWIVMKCLEKDRTRRYETANGLARDIENYLSNDPVEAGPPSNTYRLRKFMARNRGVVTAITAVAVVLVGGICMTSWAWVKAMRSQGEATVAASVAESNAQRAEDQRKKAEVALAAEAAAQIHIKKLLYAMIEDFIWDERIQSPQSLGDETKAFFRKALDHHQAFADKLGQTKEDRELAAQIQRRVANIREFGLRDNDESAVNGYRAAARIWATLVTDYPTNSSYHRNLEVTKLCLARLLEQQGKRADSEIAYREAIAVQQRLAAIDSSVRPDTSGLQDLGALLRRQGKFADAKVTCREAAAINEKLVAEFPAEDSPRFHLARSYASLGDLLRDEGNLPDAMEYYAKALPLIEAIRDPLFRQSTGLIETSNIRVKRDLILICTGDYLGAIADADDLVRNGSSDSMTLYDLACVYALSAAAVSSDAILRDQYLTKSMTLLHRVANSGYFKQPRRLASLKKDTDLDPLRERADFKKLIAELEKKLEVKSP